MKLSTKALTSVAIGAGLLMATSLNASAAIACSGDVCWRTHEAYRYPPHAGVIVHGDDWKWGPNEHYTFREHEGRGYWRGDRWERY